MSKKTTYSIIVPFIYSKSIIYTALILQGEVYIIPWFISLWSNFMINNNHFICIHLLESSFFLLLWTTESSYSTTKHQIIRGANSHILADISHLYSSLRVYCKVSMWSLSMSFNFELIKQTCQNRSCQVSYWHKRSSKIRKTIQN